MEEWTYYIEKFGEAVRKRDVLIKSTTYTMFKCLRQQNIFQNKDSKFFSLMSKLKFQALQSEQFVKKIDEPLLRFLAAFSHRKNPDSRNQL